MKREGSFNISCMVFHTRTYNKSEINKILKAVYGYYATLTS